VKKTLSAYPRISQEDQTHLLARSGVTSGR
jgi:hypothetical protein